MDFGKEISYSESVTDWYVDYMKNSIQPYLNNLNESSINPQLILLNQAFPQNAPIDLIRQNIVSFNIFYNDLTYNLISDVPQTNWFGLFTNMAGICGGSFLGISLLAIFEFLEYVFFSIYIILKHLLCTINFQLKK